MSWWDYGYQITAMANRTVLVDNNTWNNTHISRVGQAMSSSEDHAYTIMRELDVDYVLVLFGGLTGYSSDDINKFLWMVRIGGSTPEGAHIKVSFDGEQELVILPLFLAVCWFLSLLCAVPFFFFFGRLLLSLAISFLYFISLRFPSFCRKPTIFHLKENIELIVAARKPC